ncbi:hypothetical protein SAMN04515666_11933 [Bosea lupini]|uniref:Homeodomain-like domain-containing protein n=1 Tax=Bosea lupini TaxID=1036779 RepID=A0A1H8AI99_9HYPH|nr:hypothetical protein [Bosea lupini]SEM69247.1 hypothetical protein SAMN04515666_11933 [Bosea lupini]
MDDANPSGGKKEKRPGRAAFVPSDEQRATVRRMASERLAHPVIAEEVGVSVPTLRKAFVAELRDRVSGGGLFGTEDLAPATPAAPRPKRSGSGGRKRYQPGDRDREKVAVLVSSGMTVDEISRAMAISEPTLRRYYASEIETGALRKRAEVLVALHRTALKGNVAAQKEAIAIMDRARLEQLQDQVRGKAAAKTEAPAPDPVGKKEQAQLDAHGVVTRGPWSELVGRKRG